MSKLRPAQMLSPAKKLTPEVLKANPALAALIRARAAEIRNLAKKVRDSDLGDEEQLEFPRR